MAKAYSGPVELNGYKYAVKGPVYKQRVIEWPEAQPPETTQQRSTRRYLQSWNIEGSKGLLAFNDFDGNLQMCWDSSIETRFQGQLTLAPNWSTTTGYPITHIDTTDQIMDEIKGPCNIWGYTYIVYPKLNASDYSMYTAYLSGAGMNEEQIVTPSASYLYEPTDIKEHQEMLFVIYHYNASWHLHRKLYGQSWNDIPNYGGQFAGNANYNSGNEALLASVNDRLFLVIWHTVDKKLYTQYSLDGGVEWSALSELCVSQYPPHAAMAWSDADGNARLTICSPWGVIQTDAEGLNPRWLLRNEGLWQTWSGRGSLVWPTTGALYYPYGGGPALWYLGSQTQAGKLTELYWNQGALVAHDVGLNLGAKMAAGRNGPIQWLQESDRWLFAMISTGTSTGAVRYSILAYDGVGWHHVFDTAQGLGDFDPTGDKAIMFVRQTSSRLHFLWREKGSETTVDALWCSNVLDNPYNPVYGTVVPANAGYIEFATYGGNQPEIDTVWLAARVVADQLTYAETITLKYKLDGDSSWTTLGTFTQAVKELQFGSGAGVSGKRLKIRLEFAKASGSGPVLFNLCVEYLKVPPARHYYRFLIDVTETARNEGQSPKDIRKRLEAAETSVTQVTLTLAGDAQTYVKLVEPTPSITAEFPDVPNPMEAQLTGAETVEVVALELV